jgi:hypothetical protein
LIKNAAPGYPLDIKCWIQHIELNTSEGVWIQVSAYNKNNMSGVGVLLNTSIFDRSFAKGIRVSFIVDQNQNVLIKKL